MRRPFVVAVLVVAAACGHHDRGPDGPLQVAAAADLAYAFKDIGAAYTKETGREVKFTFGSTGVLAKQIANGAPFDVFAAANVSYVDDVVKAGACAGDSKALYARGRIVVWWRKGTSGPRSLAELADPRFERIAIANPEHAPYGKAAKQALAKAGVWDAVAPRMVYGENVQQTLQFAQSGNADVAIVALSLATVTDGGVTLAIDPDSIPPIDQALVVCGSGAMTDAGRAFTKYVNSEAGRAIMRRYGFVLPGEAVATAP
jgi:molybdate transport system substrate-binding protein